MESRKKLRLLTSREAKYIHVDDEEESRSSTLSDMINYWQGSERVFSSRELMEIAREHARTIAREELRWMHGSENVKVVYDTPVSYEDFQNLSKDMREVKATVRRLGNDLSEVKPTVERLCKRVEELTGVIPRVVILEEISKEEGRKLVEEYFREHGQADIEELMLNLKIPVRSIVEIIDDMKKEGKVVPKGEEET